jgi:hypothetical protein
VNLQKAQTLLIIVAVVVVVVVVMQQHCLEWNSLILHVPTLQIYYSKTNP